MRGNTLSPRCPTTDMPCIADDDLARPHVTWKGTRANAKSSVVSFPTVVDMAIVMVFAGNKLLIGLVWFVFHVFSCAPLRDSFHLSHGNVLGTQRSRFYILSLYMFIARFWLDIALADITTPTDRLSELKKSSHDRIRDKGTNI